MLTSQDVGRRVSVRRRVEGGLTDVLGYLLGVTPETLEVLAHGEVVSLATADVTAAKVVPPATPRRGWEVPAVSPDDMQRICWAGWPPREHEMLGDWALRAHGGITGRANSAMASGDPGLPLPDALRRVASWYADRGLPPLLQLPLADPANRVMAEEGWRLLHVTIVQAAPIDRVLADLPPRDDLVADARPGPVGRLAVADARPRRRRPGGARRDPHRPASGSASSRCAGTASRSASAGSRSRATGRASRRSTSHRPRAGRASAQP